MAIKNYTTKVSVRQSLSEIQAMLLAHDAQKILIDYKDQKPIGITFGIAENGKMRGFTLPAPIDGTLRVMAKEKKKCPRDQAERIAWRNLHDWIFAQMALIDSIDAPVNMPFMPYLSDGRGKTLYDVYASGQLRLGDGT